MHLIKNQTSYLFTFLLLLFFYVATSNTKKLDKQSDDSTTDRIAIIHEMQRVLDSEFALWYPLSIDTMYGGFFSDINYKWELDGRQNKMIVTQARHVWSTAHAAMFYQKNNELRNIAAHGVEFLKNKMWDQKYGGFYQLVDRSGEPLREYGSIIKTAYGNAFAIYGLARYYWASGDTAALERAQQTFQWLENHSYDSLYGGYFQYMSTEGIPFKEGLGNTPPKDQNSSIHLLESFTELYKVWPDPKLKDRLNSMLHIIRDIIVTKKGYMNLFFKRDWTPISYRDSSAAVREENYEFDHVSFGHDVETAYLMLEASEVLGMKNDTATVRIGKSMVDHALHNGWDKERSGIYDGGYYKNGNKYPSIVRNTKEWWSQVEALNTFLIMSELFPNDELQYYKKFCLQWNYCKQYLIDAEHGGWYWGGIDIVPNLKSAPKGNIWKATYHTSRALINCIRRLEHETLVNPLKHFDPVNKNATPEAKKLLDFLYSISGKNTCGSA